MLGPKDSKEKKQPQDEKMRGLETLSPVKGGPAVTPPAPDTTEQLAPSAPLTPPAPPTPSQEEKKEDLVGHDKDLVSSGMLGPPSLATDHQYRRNPKTFRLDVDLIQYIERHERYRLALEDPRSFTDKLNEIVRILMDKENPYLIQAESTVMELRADHHSEKPADVPAKEEGGPDGRESGKVVETSPKGSPAASKPSLQKGKGPTPPR
jgi:hypothetical protein